MFMLPLNTASSAHVAARQLSFRPPAGSESVGFIGHLDAVASGSEAKAVRERDLSPGRGSYLLLLSSFAFRFPVLLFRVTHLLPVVCRTFDESLRAEVAAGFGLVERATRVGEVHEAIRLFLGHLNASSHHYPSLLIRCHSRVDPLTEKTDSRWQTALHRLLDEIEVHRRGQTHERRQLYLVSKPTPLGALLPYRTQYSQALWLDDVCWVWRAREKKGGGTSSPNNRDTSDH